MKTIKVIYRIKIDKPYINIQRGIVSKLTFTPHGGEKMESIRKTKYQPAERVLFKAALIDLEEIVLPKVSEGRSIEICDIPLSKISDDIFQFEVACEVPDDTDEKAYETRVMEEATHVYKAIAESLADDPNRYNILSFKKTVCESDTSEEDKCQPVKRKINKQLPEYAK